ncbi:NAD(P)-dependent oxidoreductase [Salegentibacter maritimus]|uniref:Saccharopine dehydrogenase [NAD(+), L-lysine-forming] n=1 Tax=Salegentibacter maritimus TaxID=2794347 RepID=A0ABS0TLF8_9FLAO|nr:NAD(P)-dependent oxidoreductase [Salegentibacter maritimus]MBI6121061.1 alanine dehydrogenase [Salegentibacter maritimus]
MIKFALIKEEKTPPDRRVVFSPNKLKEVVNRFPEASFKVQSSSIRVFSDQEYRNVGFEVSDDVSDCDVLLGVKEVPLPALIPNKKYFFFSHTIKKQAYNRDLLREILTNNIELYDHEVVVNQEGHRLIGFGRYAGLVGTYNGFRGIGLKENLYTLPKVESLTDLDAMLAELNNIKVPPIKIVLTGAGKVARGAKEVLDHLKIRELEVDAFLEFNGKDPVYCNIDVLDYNKRKDETKGSQAEFFKDPSGYESNFMRFARCSDFFISGHFYGDGAPVFFTAEDAKSKNFRIKYIADISCDINGPIASTIRPSTIAEPFYGYNAKNEIETDFRENDSILVMAVDNLPCELPKDASEGFGDMFMEHVIPAFFNNDKNAVLQRARITQNGKLTPRFSYLQDFVDGKLKPNEYA